MRTTLTVMLLCPILGVAGRALALDVTVGSFESPDLTYQYFNPFMNDFGWQETGPFGSQQGFDGRLDTGVFYNYVYVPVPPNIVPIANPSPIPNPFDPAPPDYVINPEYVTGVDGNQVGFISAIADYDDFDGNGTDDYEPVSTYRILDATPYQTGQTYRLLIALSKSGRPGQIPPDTAQLAVEFIYDDGSGVTTVGSPLLVTAGELTSNALSEYYLDLLNIPLAAVGQNIGVRLRPTNSLGGNFTFDNVRITTVPEPATACVFVTLLSLRRHRRT